LYCIASYRTVTADSDRIAWRVYDGIAGRGHLHSSSLAHLLYLILPAYGLPGLYKDGGVQTKRGRKRKRVMCDVDMPTAAHEGL